MSGPIVMPFMKRVNNSFVNIDAILPGISSSTTGKIEAWVKPNTVLDNNSAIVSFGDTNGNEFLFMILLADGTINCHLRGAGQTKWSFVTDNIILTDGQWDKLTLIQGGVSPTLELNDINIPDITFLNSLNTSAWMSLLTNVDNARIGDRNANDSEEIQYWRGGIDDVKIYDGVTLEGEYLFSDNVEDTSGNDYDGINNNVSFIDDRFDNPLSAGYFK